MALPLFFANTVGLTWVFVLRIFFAGFSFTKTSKLKWESDICCIFWPGFGCCLFQTLVEISFFRAFAVSQDVPHFCIKILRKNVKMRFTIIYVLLLQLRTPFNNLLMNVVFMEVFSTFWGIPVNFASSVSQGQLMNNEVLCLTTGMGLALSGKWNSNSKIKHFMANNEQQWDTKKSMKLKAQEGVSDCRWFLFDWWLVCSAGWCTVCVLVCVLHGGGCTVTHTTFNNQHCTPPTNAPTSTHSGLPPIPNPSYSLTLCSFPRRNAACVPQVKIYLNLGRRLLSIHWGRGNMKAYF